MRIGIDARFLTHPQKGGFKTYTENLICAIEDIDRENEYFLYLDRQPVATDLIPVRPNFITRVVSGSRKFYGMPWREQYALPRQIKKDSLDLFHSPCLTAPLYLDLPLVVTIHDMIWYYPNRYSSNGRGINKRSLMMQYYKAVPEMAARKANAVITVSMAAKQSIIENMQISDDRIFVTHEAAGSLYHPLDSRDTADVVEKYHLPSNFILGIGSADPRKNIKTLVRAYASLPEPLRQTYHLAIVYHHKSLASDVLSDVEKLGILDNVHILDGVSDQDLAGLYNRASVFAFPSLEEGFGLPPLEAMACGTPVLAANNSSIPEIVGEAALQFKADDVAKLTELISNVLTDPKLQAEMKKSGIEQAYTFSWKKCGMETVQVYQKVAN